MKAIEAKDAAKYSLIGISIGFLGFYAFQVIKWVPYPWQLDFGEGFTAAITGLWAQGLWDWDISTEPFLTMMYGPVFYLISAPLVKVFGLHLAVGRLIEVISTFLIAFLLYLISGRFTNDKKIQILSGLVIFINPTIRYWSLQFRVDILAAMFDILGFYVAVKYLSEDGKILSNKFYLCSIPFLLAAFTKFTYIAGALAIGIFLLIKDRKTLLKYFPTIVIPAIIIILIGNYFTGGEFFRHIFTYNQTYPFTEVEVEGTILKFLHIFYFTLAFFFLSLAYIEKRNPLSLFLITSSIIFFLTMVRKGSAGNYAVEFIPILLLCSILVLEEVINLKIKDSLKLEYSCVLKTVIVIMLIVQVIPCFGNPIQMPTQTYTESCEYVYQLVENSNGDVLSEDATIITYAGKVPYIEFFIFTNLENLNLWDSSPYHSKIRNKEFEYIILKWPIEAHTGGFGHFSKEASKLIQENYKLNSSYKTGYYWHDYYIYEPR